MMKNSSQPLFNSKVAKSYDALTQSFFKAANVAVNEQLELHSISFEQPIADIRQLNRISGQALKACLPKLINKRFILSLRKSMQGELPCNASQFKQRLANAGPRPIEHDILFFMLYGLKHGLNEQDFNLLPVTGLAVTFNYDAELESAQLSKAQWQFNSAAQSRVYLASSSSVGDVQRQGATATQEFAREAAGTLAAEAIALLRDIFNCFKDLFQELIDFLKGKGGDGEDLLEQIEDALEDLEERKDELKEEIKEQQDEIKELEQEIENETDADDKKELQEDLEEEQKELEELQDERRNTRRAIRELKKAKRAVKAAKKALN